ncbi:hypothetical protein DICVIV_12899, partial [Dictyocaulus viviparus]
GSRRLYRSKTTRAPYQRVTRSVQRVVLFHLLCWTPFWLFNLFSSIFRVRITSQLERIVVNIIHLFPYVNCALNPLLYAYRAENFRIAFKSMFLPTSRLEEMRSSRQLGAAGKFYDKKISEHHSRHQRSIGNKSPLRCSLQFTKKHKPQSGASLHVHFDSKRTTVQNTTSLEQEQDSTTLL